jgi:hypothetical protein
MPGDRFGNARRSHAARQNIDASSSLKMPRILTRSHIDVYSKIVAEIKKVSSFTTCSPTPKHSRHCAEKTDVSFIWNKEKTNYFQIQIAVAGSNVLWTIPCNTKDKEGVRQILLAWKNEWRVTSSK